jgi:hypothetical protein
MPIHIRHGIIWVGEGFKKTPIDNVLLEGLLEDIADQEIQEKGVWARHKNGKRTEVGLGPPKVPPEEDHALAEAIKRHFKLSP